MENDKDWSKIEAKIVLDGSLHLKLDGNPSKLDYNEDNFKIRARNELSDAEENGGKVDKDVNLNTTLSCHSPKDQGTASAFGTEIYVSLVDKPKDSLAEIAPELRISYEINHEVQEEEDAEDTYADNHRHIGLPKAIQLLKILLQCHPVSF
ncbi:hypothetical protein M5K25_015121 [Dendrobium thyrsiflorum]|uniref:Uncharacterized protein n=1 Tax=Dendrobium thyrsiflorum TaxID=117978 RepID=A0ABD0UQ69_DENTH